jgi:hypothetical protein
MSNNISTSVTLSTLRSASGGAYRLGRYLNNQLSGVEVSRRAMHPSSSYNNLVECRKEDQGPAFGRINQFRPRLTSDIDDAHLFRPRTADGRKFRLSTPEDLALQAIWELANLHDTSGVVGSGYTSNQIAATMNHIVAEEQQRTASQSLQALPDLVNRTWPYEDVFDLLDNMFRRSILLRDVAGVTGVCRYCVNLNMEQVNPANVLYSGRAVGDNRKWTTRCPSKAKVPRNEGKVAERNVPVHPSLAVAIHATGGPQLLRDIEDVTGHALTGADVGAAISDIVEGEDDDDKLAAAVRRSGLSALAGARVVSADAVEGGKGIVIHIAVGGELTAKSLGPSVAQVYPEEAAAAAEASLADGDDSNATIRGYVA